MGCRAVTELSPMLSERRGCVLQEVPVCECDLALQAVVFYERLAEQPEQSTPEVWGRLAGCHQALGNYDSAVGIYLKILGGAVQASPCKPRRGIVIAI